MSLLSREHSEALLSPLMLPAAAAPRRSSRPVPEYLDKYYWWAYVHPRAVKFFERQWLVNLILCGNYLRLRDAALEELGDDLAGRTLQISCCYGNLTPRLAKRVGKCGGTLDVIDVLPVQLDNLRRKLEPGDPVRMMDMDSTSLEFADGTYDRVVLFFLFHEQPQHVRERTMREALRVVKPGGKILIVDYAAPSKWHPLRYLMLPWVGKLEPFAIEMWNTELADLLPRQMSGREWRKTSYFGGLYQRLVSTR